jgi:hypothetical protein
MEPQQFTPDNPPESHQPAPEFPPETPPSLSPTGETYSHGVIKPSEHLEPTPPAAVSVPEPIAPSGLGSTAIGPETYTVSPAAMSMDAPQVFSPEPSKHSRRRLFKEPLALSITIFLALVGGSAAAYFGYYLPNQPDNLWKTALSRTGKGYDKLTTYTNDLGKDKLQGIKLDGSFKSSGTVAADGTFTGSTQGGNGEFSGSVSATGLKVSLDTRLIKSASSTPDVYFKLDGLQGLDQLFGGAGSDYGSALQGLNNKWYFVDHTLFDQYAQGAQSNLQIGSSDVNSLLKAIDTPTKKYVFNADQKDTTLTLKQKVGKEKQDGRNTYHYKVGVNKDNLKAYNNALCDSLKDTKIYKLISGADITNSLSSCKDTSDIDRINNSDTADVWVDTHTKLIHKVRVTNKTNPATYTDVGQDYQGGDSVPFFIVQHSKNGTDSTDIRIDTTLDMKKNSLALKASFADSGSSKDSLTFSLTISPSNSAVKVEKPDGAENIIQLANDLGLGELLNGAGSSGAADTERKTDINALHGQIEAYGVENGYYPTLASLNDPKWRAANLQGFDAAALKDPAGNTLALTAKPTKGSYSYQVTPANCDNGTHGNCNSYTLTATLDDGSTYVKEALGLDTGPSTILN